MAVTRGGFVGARTRSVSLAILRFYPKSSPAAGRRRREGQYGWNLGVGVRKAGRLCAGGLDLPGLAADQTQRGGASMHWPCADSVRVYGGQIE